MTADEIEERGAFGGTNPPFKRIGCPAVENFQDEGAVKHDRYCFFQNTSCVPNKLDFPDVPKNNNVYRIIRARSWYFCGKNNTKKNNFVFYYRLNELQKFSCNLSFIIDNFSILFFFLRKIFLTADMAFKTHFVS